MINTQLERTSGGQCWPQTPRRSPGRSSCSSSCPRRRRDRQQMIRQGRRKSTLERGATTCAPDPTLPTGDIKTFSIPMPFATTSSRINQPVSSPEALVYPYTLRWCHTRWHELSLRGYPLKINESKARARPNRKDTKTLEANSNTQL